MNVARIYIICLSGRHGCANYDLLFNSLHRAIAVFFQGLNIPHISDFKYVGALMVGIAALRYSLERWVFRPFGRRVLANRPSEIGAHFF